MGDPPGRCDASGGTGCAVARTAQDPNVVQPDRLARCLAFRRLWRVVGLEIVDSATALAPWLQSAGSLG